MEQSKTIELSVIIVSYNVEHFLHLCLESVYAATKNIRAEVIVIDNASADKSVDMVKKQFP
jgi:N-acetylglucosaminyl-diphospho-decaprenol L-rhamnosyltransferase